ncbi:MAG: sulfotransferase, partial [Rhodospirillales bacterium]
KGTDDGMTDAKTIMDRMNRLLAEEDARLTASFSAPSLPVTFLTSPPRCASTLFQQLAASTTNIGYVSNVMARFWSAPYIGAMIEQDLRDPDFVSGLKSYGRHYNPVGAEEPHEWGWFWQHWLRLEKGDYYGAPDREIDFGGLNRTLAAIEKAKGAPLLFDNIFAMTNLGLLARNLPRVLAVNLRRDPYYVANSIIKARIDRYGDIDAFHSQKPRNIKQILGLSDPIEQSVAQVRALMDEIEETLAALPGDSVLHVDYPDIVERPHLVMERFAAFLNSQGASVRLRDPLPAFPQLRNRNNPAFIDPAHRERLDYYFVRYFPDAPRPVEA